MNLRYLHAILAAATLTGCVTQPQSVVQPTNVTVGQALKDVVDGIAEAQKEELAINGKVGSLGLEVCSLTTTLNITASANNKVVLDASIKPPPPVTFLGLSGSAERDASASRGNTVFLVMNNPDCAAHTDPAKKPVLLKHSAAPGASSGSVGGGSEVGKPELFIAPENLK